MSIDLGSTSTVEAMKVPDPQVPLKAQPRRFTASYKKRILAEYASLSKSERSALLRREGLYSSILGKWRGQAAKAAGRGQSDSRPGPKPDRQAREVSRLQRENRKLAKELENSRRITDVQAKLCALLDDLSNSATNENDSSN